MRMKEFERRKDFTCMHWEENVWIITVVTGPASAVNWCVIGTAVTYIAVKFSSILMLL